MSATLPTDDPRFPGRKPESETGLAEEVELAARAFWHVASGIGHREPTPTELKALASGIGQAIGAADCFRQAQRRQSAGDAYRAVLQELRDGFVSLPRRTPTSAAFPPTDSD